MPRRFFGACAVLSIYCCVLLSACLAQPSGTMPETSVDPANATYAGIYDEPVTLVDGLYEGEPFMEGDDLRPRLRLVEGLEVRNDLDEDGVSEVAVLLTENSGGTGTFLYVAVLKLVDGDWRNAATAMVGDRVQVKRMYRDGFKVALDVVQGGPNDGACCPTQNATRRWLFDEGALVESGETITGTLSLADISGVEWRLTSINDDESVPESVSITLTIDGSTASGKSGCNSYNSTVTEGDQPGGLSFGPIGGTKMLCPEPVMEWETRYRAALQNSTQIGFVAGDLLFGSSVDGDYVSLRFSR